MAEENNNKETPKSAASPDQAETNEELFDEYLKPKRFNPRFWVWIVLVVAAILMAFIYKVTVVDTTVAPRDLKDAVELINLDSQWVESEKIDTKDFKGIVLVPQISFQVRNVGKIDLQDVYFLGVFRLLDRAKTLGEGFEMTLKKPLKPGQESERITLTCQFGYRASSKVAFKKNSKEWGTSMVEVFTKTGASQLIFLKNFYISRKIEGLEVDFKLTDKSVEELMTTPPTGK